MDLITQTLKHVTPERRDFNQEQLKAFREGNIISWILFWKNDKK